MIKAWRQGELVFVPRKDKAERKKEGGYYSYGFESKKDNVVREGEMTGHMHKAEQGTLLEKSNELVLDAPEGSIITHPEHKPTKLPGKSDISPVGEIDIIIQREYDEAKDRQVLD